MTSAEYMRAWRKANPGYDAKWRAAHPEYLEANREHSRRRSKEHPEYQAQYRKNNKDKFRDYDTKREALKRGAKHTPYNRHDIYQRDNWICGICAKPVDPSLKRPSPLSASIDHILALARGGSDTPENVQCAHLICNMQKHASRRPIKFLFSITIEGD